MAEKKVQEAGAGDLTLGSFTSKTDIEVTAIIGSQLDSETSEWTKKDFMELFLKLLRDPQKQDINAIRGELIRKACEYDSLDLIKLLVTHGGNLGVHDNYNRDLFYIAIERAKPEIISFLIESKLKQPGLDVNAKYATDSFGSVDTLINLACKYGLADQARELTAKGADLGIQDKQGHDAIYNAIENKSPELIRGIIEGKLKLADLDINAKYGTYYGRDFTLISLACKFGLADLAKELITRGADLNIQDSFHNDALYYAFENKNPELIKVIAEAKFANPYINFRYDIEGSYIVKQSPAINLACKFNLVDWAKDLAAKGASLDFYDAEHHAIYYALENNNPALIAAIIEGTLKRSGIDINEVYNPYMAYFTLIHWAFKYGLVDLAKELIARGANLETRDSNGKNAIAYAVEAKNHELMKLIIDFRLTNNDINTKFGFGEDTLLNLVCKAGMADLAKELISKGADLGIKDKYNRDATFYAARSKSPELIKVIIEHQLNELSSKYSLIGGMLYSFGNKLGLVDNYVDIYAKWSQEGYTLISLACKAGLVDLARDLLDKGANPAIGNKHNHDAIFHALKSENKDALIKLISDKTLENIDSGKVDLNTKYVGGNTLLSLASKYGLVDLANKLLAKGADPTIINEAAHTAISYALDSFNDRLIDLFKKGDAQQANDLSLKEMLLLANKRGQPYINLANKKFAVEKIFKSDEIDLKGFKSIYFRTDKLVLDKEFALTVNKLIAEGMREMLIFCDKSQSQLTTDNLNQFLNDNLIRINFKVAQITSDEFEQIRTDSIGTRDILGFSSLQDNKINYQDGISLNLLNNAESDKTITDNYNKYRDSFFSSDSSVEIDLPYISHSQNTAEEKRVKDLKKAPVKPSVDISVSVDVDVDVSIDVDKKQELENEVTLDLDIDQEQLQNKYTQCEAWPVARKLKDNFFYDCDVATNHYDLRTVYTDRFIDDLFVGSIKHITHAALEIVVKNFPYFRNGIDPENLPIGLGLKDGILFATMQRLSSMPVNEFTFDPFTGWQDVVNPFEYSWLGFASKASITLNDVYDDGIFGTEFAPWIDSHANHLYSPSGDSYLDKPNNLYKASYSTKSVGSRTKLGDYKFSSKDLAQYHITKDNLSQIQFDLLKFDATNLLPIERKKIDSIYSELKARGLDGIITQIFRHNKIDRGEVLLEAKNTVFFDKLFDQILPFAYDNKKLIFFQKILSSSLFKDGSGPSLLGSNLESVFEGLDGCYRKVDEALKQHKHISAEEKEEVYTKFIEAMQKQLANAVNMKVVVSRIFSVLEYLKSQGGGILEQLEYFIDDASLLDAPPPYYKAKEIGANVMHSYCELGSGSVKDAASGKELFKIAQDTLHNTGFAANHFTASMMRFISTIPPHQRAALNTMHQDYLFSRGQNDVEYKLSLEILMSPRNKLISYSYYPNRANLEKYKTIEYVTSKVILFDIPVKKIKKHIAQTKIDTELLKIINAKTSGLNDESKITLDQDIIEKIGLTKDIATLYQETTASLIDQAQKAFSSDNDMKADKDLAELKKLVDSRGKVEKKDPVYVSAAIVNDEVNFVNNFTTVQAHNSIKLMALNIAASTGEHYSALYPDQELKSYLSLFNILFKDLRIYEEIEVAKRDLKAGKDNKQKLALEEETIRIAHRQSEKELKHSKLIDNFIKVFEGDDKLNFSQVVGLGLVNYFTPDAFNEVNKNADKLLKYGDSFTQLFRVLLSSKAGESTDELEQIKAKTQLITKNINFLNSKVGEIYVHDMITKNGSASENLVLFASCLGRKESLTVTDVENLLKAIDGLDRSLKGKILDSIAHTKLPFKKGKLVEESKFSILNIEDLSDTDKVNQILEKAHKAEIDYSKLGRFNDSALDSRKNSKINLNKLEDEFAVSIPDKLKGKNYKEIKKIITSDANLIKSLFKIEADATPEAIDKLSFALSKKMFQAITTAAEGEEVAKLLFNHNKTLSQQITELDNNNNYLQDILDQYEGGKKATIVKSLVEKNIPANNITPVLIYLKNIPVELLNSKGFASIDELIYAIPVKVINSYTDGFKIATDFLLHNDIPIKVNEFYNFINRVLDVDSKPGFLKKILAYCQEHSDFSIIKIVSYLDKDADNVGGVLEWILSITPDEINKLDANPNLNLKKLLQIKNIEKVKALADIALNLGDEISSEQYKTLISKISKTKLENATLLKSYFLAKAPFSLHKEEKLNFKKNLVEFIFKHLDEHKKLQEIYSDSNLKRFEFNESVVVSKIDEIYLKNAENELNKLPVAASAEIYKSFITMMQHAKAAKDLNSNEIREEIIKLKRLRESADESDVGETRPLDLKFMGIALEALYREINKFPYETQILSVINALVHADHNIIEEIATGQGKSITTALTASALWFTGQTVDVVSSSKALASRDLKEFSSFYDLLGIEHGNSAVGAQSEQSDYKKGGINFATASDLALFRADREFYSNKNDPSFNADVSLICDEVDATITSEVNYKLAMPLVNMKQEEVRILFEHILEFSQTEVFKNAGVSRNDDIKNLKIYLESQFSKYKGIYKYPLDDLKIKELEAKHSEEANNLIHLNSALKRCYKEQGIDKFFDKLLDSALVAQELKEGIDYVVLVNDNAQSLAQKGAADDLMRAIPIIKSQPSKGTNFGDGVQTFLHLAIEKQYRQFAHKFDMSSPTSTIFNVSPKNFFDYYKLSGGRVVGLTGTVGNKGEIEEFRSINKMLSFGIPRHETSKLKISEIIVEDSTIQNEKLINILNDNATRPTIIFCDNTKEAERIFTMLKSKLGEENNDKSLQIYAASNMDTGAIHEVVGSAGKANNILVTTPMLGRGTDFFTENQAGYLSVNLCTDTTYSGLLQIYGRVARNGANGEVISLFNKEVIKGADISEHMDSISFQEALLRLEQQPLSDVLTYFSKFNKDNPFNAISCNDDITGKWKKLLAENYKTSNPKTLLELREELVKAVKQSYPSVTAKLDAYLKMVDGVVPEKTVALSELKLNDVLSHIKPYDNEALYKGMDYKEMEKLWASTDLSKLDNLIPVFSKVADQDYTIPFADQGGEIDLSANKALFFDPEADKYWDNIGIQARAISVSRLIKVQDEKYPEFFNDFYKSQSLIMLAHAFDLDFKNAITQESEVNVFDKFAVSNIAVTVVPVNKVVLTLINDKVHYQTGGKSPKELKAANEIISVNEALYNKIKLALEEHQKAGGDSLKTLDLTDIEKEEIFKFDLNSNYKDAYITPHTIDPEGSIGELMIYEFKKSFKEYKDEVYKSPSGTNKEIDAIDKVVDNYRLHNEVKMDQMKYGEYQAINVITRITDSDYHAESILTDGKLLFWINRGARKDDKPGIKIYKIVKDFEKVKEVIESFKKAIYQDDVVASIVSLIKEESAIDLPEPLYIRMKDQVVGNCGWVQTKGMLLAIAVASRLSKFDELPDPDSKDWQKIIKDTRALYSDFTTYDRVKRAEEVIYTLNKNFVTKFLSQAEKDEIDGYRDMLDRPFTQDLLTKLTAKWGDISGKFSGRIYDKQAKLISDALELESNVESDIGIALGYSGLSRQEVKVLLAQYQANDQNSFENLDKVYNVIKESKLTDGAEQSKLFAMIVEDIVSNSYDISGVDKFVEKLNSIISSREKALNNKADSNDIELHLKTIIEMDQLHDKFISASQSSATIDLDRDVLAGKLNDKIIELLKDKVAYHDELELIVSFFHDKTIVHKLKECFSLVDEKGNGAHTVCEISNFKDAIKEYMD